MAKYVSSNNMMTDFTEYFFSEKLFCKINLLSYRNGSFVFLLLFVLCF